MSECKRKIKTKERKQIITEQKKEEQEELWSTEVWLKNMMYYLKTERMMFRGLM